MSRGSPPECRRRPIHDVFPNRSGRPATGTMPTSTRRFSHQKNFSTRRVNPPTATPDDVIEANRRGGPWGAAFRKFSTLWTDRLRVPSQRFLNFWNRPLPIPCQPHPGKRGSSRVFDSVDSTGASSSREEEPGLNGRKEFSFLIKIIRKNRPRVLTKYGNSRRVGESENGKDRSADGQDVQVEEKHDKAC
jgi:hypothetical protein